MIVQYMLFLCCYVTVLLIAFCPRTSDSQFWHDIIKYRDVQSVTWSIFIGNTAYSIVFQRNVPYPVWIWFTPGVRDFCIVFHTQASCFYLFLCLLMFKLCVTISVPVTIICYSKMEVRRSWHLYCLGKKFPWVRMRRIGTVMSLISLANCIKVV